MIDERLYVPQIEPRDEKAYAELVPQLWITDFIGYFRKVVVDFLPPLNEGKYLTPEQLASFEENLHSITKHLPQLNTNALQAIINNQGHEEDKVKRMAIAQLRWLMGWALAELILVGSEADCSKEINGYIKAPADKSQADSSSLWSLTCHYRVWGGFDDALKYYLQDETRSNMASSTPIENYVPNSDLKLKSIGPDKLKKRLFEAATEIIAPLLSHPTDWLNSRYASSGFGKYIDTWLKNENKHISMYWDRTFSRCWGFGFGKLQILDSVLLVRLEDFVTLASYFKVPGQLEEVLYTYNIRCNPEIIIKLLEMSPLIQSSCTDALWNGEILVLEVIGVACNYGTELIDYERRQASGVKKQEDSQIKRDIDNFYLNVAQALSQRADFSFLASAYIEHLLPQVKDWHKGYYYTQPNQTAESVFLEILIEMMKSTKNAIKFDYIPDKEAIEDFITLGLSSQSPPPIDLPKLISALKINCLTTDAERQEYIEIFHGILATKSEALYTSQYSSILPDANHSDIANLYAGCDDSEKLWLETWHYMSEARFTFFKNIFDGNIDAIRPKIYFLLCVGLAAFSGHSQKEDKFNQEMAGRFSDTLWTCLWDLLIQDTQIGYDFYSRALEIWCKATYWHAKMKHGNAVDAFNMCIAPKIKNVISYPEMAFAMLEGLWGIHDLTQPDQEYITKESDCEECSTITRPTEEEYNAIKSNSEGCTTMHLVYSNMSRHLQRKTKKFFPDEELIEKLEKTSDLLSENT